jgi:hypothetical protein
MMECRSCSKMMEEDSVFCRFCGNPVQGCPEGEILPALFTQITDELRARRDAEHIYTAAAVGSFGAIAWGVASLAGARPLHVSGALLDPAIVASIGSLLLAAAVITKIEVEHWKYRDLRIELGRTSERILKVYNLPAGYLPKGLTSGKAGAGHVWSILIVAGGALLATAFCLSVWFSSH